MGAGLLVYLILPLRALQHPPINWGNPVTLDGFSWLITGGPYQDQLLTLSPVLVWERIRATAGSVLDQAGLPGLILTVAGLVFFFKPSPLHRNTIWIMAASLASPSLQHRDPSVFDACLPGFDLGWDRARGNDICTAPQNFAFGTLFGPVPDPLLVFPSWETFAFDGCLS
jgi:hypothetical protein